MNQLQQLDLSTYSLPPETLKFNRSLCRFSPIVMHLSNDRKSATSSTIGRNFLFFVVVLKSSRCATSRRNAQSCELRKSLDVEPLLRIERSQLLWFSHVTKIPRENWRGETFLPHPEECNLPTDHQVVLITSPIWSARLLCGASRTIRDC